MVRRRTLLWLLPLVAVVAVPRVRWAVAEAGRQGFRVGGQSPRVGFGLLWVRIYVGTRVLRQGPEFHLWLLLLGPKTLLLLWKRFEMRFWLLYPRP